MHLFSKFIHEKISITKSKNFQGDLFLATMEIWAGFVCAGEYLNPYKKQYTFEAALIHFPKIEIFKYSSTKVTYK